jgi:predicted nucleic acid-binding Zn ribbon protein
MTFTSLADDLAASKCIECGAAISPKAQFCLRCRSLLNECREHKESKMNKYRYVCLIIGTVVGLAFSFSHFGGSEQGDFLPFFQSHLE